MKTTKKLAILAVLLVLNIAGIVKGQRKMYWTEAGANRNQRANLDGSAVEDLVSSLTPTGIAIDIAGGKMYWIAMSADNIYRANLDGSGVETLVTGLSTPYDIGLDIAAGKMYWTDWGADKIQRANLDGSGIEDVVTGLNRPRGMALDIAGGKMYWADYGPYRIRRANLDGSGIEDLVTGLVSLHDVAVDIAGGKIYWVDAGTADKIQRSNLDGSGIEDLVTGLDYPYGIALDILKGKMYWADYNADKIQRANLDGSSVEDIVTGLNKPRLITVLPPTVTYQGRLLDDNSVADGLYDLRFAAYNEEGDVNALTVAGAQDVDVIDGYFTVELGLEGVAFNGKGVHWLEVAVRPADSNDPGDYVTLTPRQQLTPTPYAVYAENAGVDNDWMVSGSNMYSIPSGNVGIGTMSPSTKLHVEDDKLGSTTVTIHNENNAGSERLHFGDDPDIDAGILVFGSTNASYPGKWQFFNNKTSGHFDWLTSSSTKMTLANNGYLGIGTTSPSSRLHVEGDTTTGVKITIRNQDNSSSERLYFGNDAGMIVWKSAYSNDPGKWRFFNNRTSAQYDWATSGLIKMTLANNGNLGLGITIPESQLHMRSSQPEVRFEESDQSGKKWTIAGYNSGLTFAETGEGYAMHIEPGGNVGIRTTNPGAGLHLKGTSYPSSFMFLESSNNEDTGFRLYEGTTVKWHLFNEAGAGGLSLRNNAYSSVLFAKQGTGDVGIGTMSPQAKLDVAGRTRTQVLEITGGSDLSEQFEVTGEHQKVEPGMVVCIDPASCGNLVVSHKAYDRTVAGIVSGAGGVKPGMLMGQRGTMADGEHPVALTGRAYCRADASKGPITPGDLLTTSDVAGHAMKVTDYDRAQGAILGKAMSSLNEGRGLVLVLVTLQ
jgi:sugar lactone lactonase YvrE